jgi:hypothetical protein
MTVAAARLLQMVSRTILFSVRIGIVKAPPELSVIGSSRKSKPPLRLGEYKANPCSPEINPGAAQSHAVHHCSAETQ